MANVIVCCDGTWNTEDQSTNGVPVPTNVVRLFNALAEADGGGIAQKRYYHPGVGTEGSLIDKIKGGAAGVGLDKNIMGAYRWLCGKYVGGDNIALFGFSRGAFTARSLAGMIGACGLLDLTGVNDKEAWERVQTAYAKGYRVKPEERGDWAEADWRVPCRGSGAHPFHRRLGHGGRPGGAGQSGPAQHARFPVEIRFSRYPVGRQRPPCPPCRGP